MISDYSFWLIAGPAVLIAGIAKGGFAGGVSFVAVPLLAILIGPIRAAAVMLPLLMFMDLLGLRAYWGRWDWRQTIILGITAVPGIGLGYLLFGVVPEAVIKIVLGLISVSFALFSIAQRLDLIATRRDTEAPRRHGPRAAICGAAAGFTSFVAHAGGPPVAIHLLSQPISKTTYQATTIATFFWINLVKAPFYGDLGLFAWENLRLSLSLAPIAAAGLLIGVRAHTLVSERIFFGIAYAALTIVGLKLFFEGLAAL